MALPPGFRFHPTDEELVAYYLRRKVAGRNIEFNMITEIDLYKQEPWDLPEKSFLPGSDMEWYFFSPRDKKYPNGLRTNRATEAGYWKATGKDRNVKKAGRVIGMKKTLVFYLGRAPHGERTDWVMHEYRLDEEECEKVHASQDLFVLCRVFKKSGVGPRSGEDRGPQTYVDDDVTADVPVDQNTPGSFAEALKKALDPDVSAPDGTVEAPASGDGDSLEARKDLESEPEPVSTPPLSAQIDTYTSPAQSLSVDDYTCVEEARDVIGLSLPPEDYNMHESSFTQVDDDNVFWDRLPTIASELDLPSASEVLSDGSIDRWYPFGDILGEWPAERELETSNGMMWSYSGSNVQQRDESGGGGCFDVFQLEALDVDDMLPPLVEERESMESRGNVPDVVENVNQQLRIRGLRARSRAARLQLPSEEVQRGAPSWRNVIHPNENAPQLRMSNTNFRGNMGPEVPTHAGQGNTVQPATWAAPSDPAPDRSSNYETTLAIDGLCPDLFFTSNTVFRISDGTANEDNLFSSSEDEFFDFAVDDEEFLIRTSELDNNVSSATTSGTAAEDVSVDGTSPAGQAEKHSQNEGPPQLSPSLQGGILEETRPLSKPLAGLMKLLGSLPALPASAAECPPIVKPLLEIGLAAPNYSSIHVSAVTVTCTSSPDGAQQVQAALTDCRLHGDAQGVYQQVVSGSWQSVPVEPEISQHGGGKQKPLCANCDTTVVGGKLPRRVVRGSNSGFVFVFVLGAVSALCWFLVIRGLWRLASHVFTSVF